MKPWAIIVGATRWLTCQSVDDSEAHRRASVCAQCPARVLMRLRGTTIVAGFCGKPMEPTNETCGCLVTHGSDNQPAGKSTCANEVCPQARW